LCGLGEGRRDVPDSKADHGEHFLGDSADSSREVEVKGREFMKG
jgi:hypothetical protein